MSSNIQNKGCTISHTNMAEKAYTSARLSYLQNGPPRTVCVVLAFVSCLMFRYAEPLKPRDSLSCRQMPRVLGRQRRAALRFYC